MSTAKEIETRIKATKAEIGATETELRQLSSQYRQALRAGDDKEADRLQVVDEEKQRKLVRLTDRLKSLEAELPEARKADAKPAYEAAVKALHDAAENQRAVNARLEEAVAAFKVLAEDVLAAVDDTWKALNIARQGGEKTGEWPRAELPLIRSMEDMRIAVRKISHAVDTQGRLHADAISPKREPVKVHPGYAPRVA